VKHWKAGVAEDLRHRLFKGDVIDETRLKALVTDYDQMAKLRELYGPSFQRNMETLNEAMGMIKKISNNVQAYPKNNLFTDIARMTYAPPLSAEGRIVSFGQNARARSFHKDIYKALEDPAELAKLASRAERTMLTLRKIAVGSAVGASLADQDEYRD
jgi:hypothetical protein